MSKLRDRFKWNEIKIFFTSMAFTALVLTLFSGLVIAEKNTRRVAFGEEVSIIKLVSDENNHSLRLEIMGNNFNMNFPTIHQIITKMK